jgi:heme-degrading monooxygenase HmoA
MCPVTLINHFDVSPGSDEAFVASWEEARDFAKFKGGFLDTALHRSVASDADFRFVGISHLESVDAWRRIIADPGFPEGAPRPAHAGLYEVVFEDDGVECEGAVLIQAFDVPYEDHEASFTHPWHEIREHLASGAGYRGTRLHHSVHATFRFVSVSGGRPPRRARSSSVVPSTGSSRPACPTAAARASTRSSGGNVREA